MPSAEETTYLIEVMPDNGINPDSYGSRDVDVLVSRIKENLRLSSLKSRSSLAQKIRPKPYNLHPNQRSWSETNFCELCTARNNSFSESNEQQNLYHSRDCCRRRRQRKVLRDFDDYECFTALLKQGALIKEAVKRLQTNPDDDDLDSEEERRGSTSATSTTLDSMDEEDDDNVVDNRTRNKDYFYRRKQFDYDSEDDKSSYTTVYPFLDELE